MATGNVLKIRRPKAVLFDLSGTITKSDFFSTTLLPYIKPNVRPFLEETYNDPNTVKDLAKLRQAALDDPGAPKIPDSDASRDIIIAGAANYVAYCMNTKKESKAVTLLKFHIWFDAYEKKKLETPVYTDAAIKIQKWRNEENIKVCVFSNAWAEATKKFLAHTNHGNMNLIVEDHFDSTIGPLSEPETFNKVAGKIALPPEEILFLTKSGEEAYAAGSAGFIVVLVVAHQRAFDKLDERARGLPRVRTFNDILFVDA